MQETYDKDFYRSPVSIFKSQVRKDLKGVEPDGDDLKELASLAGLPHWVDRTEFHRAHWEWNEGVHSSLNRKWIKFLLSKVGNDPFSLQDAYQIRNEYDGKGDKQSVGNPTGVSLFACVHRGVMERIKRAEYRFLVEGLP